MMGYTQLAIAEHFGLERSTVSYFCDGIKPAVIIPKKRYVSDKPSPFSEMNKIKCQQYIAKCANNQGKDYEDYLIEEKKRKEKDKIIGQQRLEELKLLDKRTRNNNFISIENHRSSRLE